MSSNSRHHIKTSAYVILTDPNGRVLFARRSGTGYMDGKLGLPSGHTELNESFRAAAIRELREEAGVIADEATVMHAISLHRYQPSGQNDYIDVLFRVTKWDGEPVVTEPHKCSEVLWAHPADVKDQMIPYLVHVFEAIDRGDSFVEIPRRDDE